MFNIRRPWNVECARGHLLPGGGTLFVKTYLEHCLPLHRPYRASVEHESRNLAV